MADGEFEPVIVGHDLPAIERSALLRIEPIDLREPALASDKSKKSWKIRF